jgi:hypothetical protein
MFLSKENTMKKISLLVSGAVLLLMTGCGTSALGTAAGVLGALNSTNGTSDATTTATTAASKVASAGTSAIGTLLTNATSGNNLANILTSVIGLDKVSQSTLVGTWKYKEPGCAFTSESTLASAGGEVVAATVKEKLSSSYKKVGFSSSNTSFTFNEDGTFTANIVGKAWSGTYTFDESTQAIKLKGLLLSLSGYTKKNSDGIAVLFESKKILTLIKTLTALSGNSTLSTIGDLSSNYTGVRVGFDLTK